MMTNLFSIFDPSSSMLSLSWISIPLSVSILSLSTWKLSTSITKIFKSLTNMFFKEVSLVLPKNQNNTSAPILLIFVLVLILNFLALYPNIFSPTSHLTITLPISILAWLSIMIFGWTKNTKHMMVHLLPQGTPPVLMMFMVLIEMTSNIIRPITLCVRLTANLIAGHLLMSLLGNALLYLPLKHSLLLMLAPLILTILESAVACIQAYVFMTLITLYTTEIN